MSSEEFLARIGAIGNDRAIGKSGLRAAGLLMFGRIEAINEAFPYYMVDYQERPDANTDVRWVDRIVPDGSWSGNLYDFFQKAYRKLVADLKAPFKLKDGARVENTPVHEAIREALINTIIHADFTGRTSILAVKRPDMFFFRNPGLMRVTVEQAVLGGASDCRNRNLQRMFRHIGFGDQAGSGIPKIYRNWKEQHWRSPRLAEDAGLEFTLLELRMVSLFPEDSLKLLDELFGERFRTLPELERVILVAAVAEDSVNHARIKEMSTKHPKDISAALTHLVQEGMLIKQGETRGSTYTLPARQPAEMPLFGPNSGGNSPHKAESSPILPVSSPNLSVSSPILPVSSPNLRDKLSAILARLGFSKMPGKLSPEVMREIIVTLCAGEPITTKELSVVLERKSKTLQELYLTPMLGSGALELKYPDAIHHPKQAYRAKVIK